VLGESKAHVMTCDADKSYRSGEQVPL
jgi:hypothetical protein